MFVCQGLTVYITSWEIHGETVETVSDFILGGSKITADGDCSHKIKQYNEDYHLVPLLHGKQMGKQWKQWLSLFFWDPKSLLMVTAAIKLKEAYFLEVEL